MSRATPNTPPGASEAEIARYDPIEAEPRWARAWLDSGLLGGDPDSDRERYAIAIPPPNVTGSLHLGHALNGSIQDALIRWHRMAGRETEWIYGTDHAGIATQAVVEKELAREGLTRQELGREEFERRVWAWRETYGGRIREQFQRLGCTLDYGRERFTMDEGYARAVLRVFVGLYERGWIYRDRYLVNWDPGLRSAISDLEVEPREVTDTLVRIAYPLADGSGEVVVATVRPETMLGDTAVAVSPVDERYRDLVGRSVVLPLVGRELPIIADEHVDPEFGTGALKITPAHDPNDFEIGRRHGLEQVSVIGEDGRMTEAAGPAYAGLPTDEAAARVLADLRAQDLVRGEEPYTHTVPFSHRSGARVEPLISLQWFCDMKALAEPAIAAVEDGRVRFHPRMPHTKVYLDWMRNIRPWCVSRQLWWGHRLPVWYRGEETYVGEAPPAGEGWERDPDVLDTWFSSALWPFATLGWPEDAPELRAFYPTQVLSTAREIIFLWVARMVMMGVEFTGREPFGDVYIHSVIQAPDGRRMSKSLGTGIDPLDVIAEHGADALRFGLLLMSSTQDVRYSEDRVRQGRQLVTKLWNATRLVVDRGGAAGTEPPALERLADRWIASRTAAAVVEYERLLGVYEFSALADLVYHLIFDDYCDWYLELLKAGEGTPEAAGHVLEQLLAMAHPLLPFITEEAWSRLPASEGLMLSHATARAPGPVDPQAEAGMATVREDVTRVRAERAERGLPPRAPMTVRLPASRSEEAVAAALALAAPVTQGPPVEGAVATVTPAEVDPGAERARLRARLAEAEAERARAEGKLANARFVERAPAELVEAEREKVPRYAAEAERLRAALAEMGGE